MVIMRTGGPSDDAAAMIGAGTQAPLAALALVLELSHSGFALMAPMIAATVAATAVSRHIDGYSARLPANQTQPRRRRTRPPDPHPDGRDSKSR